MMSCKKSFAAAALGVWLLQTNPVMAAGAPQPPSISQPLALTLITIAASLLLAIGILAKVVINMAEVYTKRILDEKKKEGSGSTTLPVWMTGFLLLTAWNSFGQESTGSKPPAPLFDFGGLGPTAFYSLLVTIFIELLVLIWLGALLLRLIAKEKKFAESVSTKAVEVKISWWERINKFRSLKEEQNIDLGHNYDGIRELDNRLPPWWLYGFYVTIIFSVVYLWRYHVAHSAPSSEEEFQIAMTRAEEEKQAYLKRTASNVDENTVTLIADAAQIQAGNSVYQANCAACHGSAGQGGVGPNLTDEYWLHGGSVKDIFRTIKYGVVEKGMRAWQEDLSPVQMSQVTSYIKKLQGTKPENAKEPQGEIFREQAAASAAVDSSAQK